MSNRAYMVIASLAWNLKAWFGMLMPNAGRGEQVLKMEFRRFLNTVVMLPCQTLEEFFPLQMEYECYRAVKNTIR